MAINNGIFNNYTVTPRNLTQYKAFRGVTDFSNIGQFNQYESGYQFLSVLSIPKFMTKLGDIDGTIKQMNANFVHMLEYEFRGLDGLPDMTSDQFEITDGINSVRMINKVMEDTSITVSSNYFEKSGGLITKYSEYYLSGIKDPKTQAKSYHGLIANGDLAPGLENEVFTLLYYATDNTYLRLERAVLLANCQLTKAEKSMYAGSRDNISNKEMSIEFNCFPITGYMVDKAAKALLQDITAVNVSVNNGTVQYNKTSATPKATFDSADYKYGIMDGNQPEAIASLVDAINTTDL
jgi:hypothetical protein